MLLQDLQGGSTLTQNTHTYNNKSFIEDLKVIACDNMHILSPIKHINSKYIMKLDLKTFPVYLKALETALSDWLHYWYHAQNWVLNPVFQSQKQIAL